MKELFCQEKNITVRRSWRSHTLRLTVDRRGHVVLTVPFLCPPGTARSFLEKHQDWIAQQSARRASSLTFTDGGSISVLGKSLKICHEPNRRRGTEAVDGILFVSGDIAFLNRRITDYVKKETALYIDQKAHDLANRIQKKINRISLKDTTSRWGSCSGKQNLNFCWRLGLAPLFVLDYIIAHEVAHLQEMNHGPAFWRLVGTLCDCRSDAEIWLRRYGHTLR